MQNEWLALLFAVVLTSTVTMFLYMRNGRFTSADLGRAMFIAGAISYVTFLP